MLNKLLKYEIKATGRVFVPLFLTLLIFAFITKIISSLDQWKTPAIISMSIYIIILVGMFVSSLIVMIQRFYRNLLSDEGYLMFTLPTKPWQHILSKLLVSMLWMIASTFTAILSILIIAYKQGIIIEISSGLTLAIQQINLQLGASAYLLVFEFILSALVSLASGILLVYASIAIGHLFSRHKMLGSFGSFIVLNSLAQILFILVGMTTGKTFSYIHISTKDLASMQSVAHLAISLGIMFTGLLSAAYFAATNFILCKRLNLE